MLKQGFKQTIKGTEVTCVECVNDMNKCFRLKEMLDLNVFWIFSQHELCVSVASFKKLETSFPCLYSTSSLSYHFEILKKYSSKLP